MSTRRIVIFLALLVVVGLVAFGAAWAHCNRGYVPIAFAREQWFDAGPERRGHMADDLLESHDLVGMTRAEVEALLGQPDDDQTHIRRYRYHLG